MTGSECAGAAVGEIVVRHLKKVALELGGSDRFIVLSTDDLEEAVGAAGAVRLDNSGQAGNGAKRFIVVDELYDAFLERFVAAMAAVQPGDPTDESTSLGPRSSLVAAEKLQDHVDQAVAAGATLALGGQRDGAYFPPTVLSGVTPEMDAYTDEFFGPVAMVFRVSGEDGVVALANDTNFGLGAYLFTTDAAQAARMPNKIEVGMVYVNIIGADSPGLPFGGVKRSGMARELGMVGADEFVIKKRIRVGA